MPIIHDKKYKMCKINTGRPSLILPSINVKCNKYKNQYY